MDGIDDVDEELDAGGGGHLERRLRVALGGHRRLVLVAGAVLVLLVVGAAVTLSGTRHRSRTPVAVATVRPAAALRACPSRIPASWSAPVRAATTTVPGVLQASVGAVTADGGVVLLYEQAGDSGGLRVGLLAPRTSSVQPLFALPTTGRDAGSDVSTQVAGRTLLLEIRRQVDLPTSQGGGATDVPDRYLTIDLDTGRRQLIASAADFPHGIISDAYLQDGTVYWQVGDRASQARLDADGETDRIWARATAPGARRRVVAAGTGLALRQDALGVAWTPQQLDRPREVPALVVSHLAAAGEDATYSASTDGRAWAWLDPGGSVAWWGGAGESVQRVDGAFRAGAVGGLFAVAGPFVFLNAANTGRAEVLDARTGALAPLRDDLVVTGSFPGLVGTPLPAPGTGSARPDQVMRVAVASLPELRC